MYRQQVIIRICFIIGLIGTFLRSSTVYAQTTGPTMGIVTVQTPGSIEKFAKFEISFPITTVATNPFYPYDPARPTGVVGGEGVSVDALFLPPGQTIWTNAKKTPCFYFQPYEELGTGNNIALVPKGAADWRCRFTPEMVGAWQYKIQATDRNGTSETTPQSFTAIDSTRKGFIRISQTDNRFFEYSDGTPFTSLLLNVEEGSPFNSVASIRTNIQKLGQNGIRFIRWFPTGEGANYNVVPFGDSLRVTWRFAGASTITDVDSTAGKLLSFAPTFYAGESFPAIANATYRLMFRAKVTGERVLRPEINGTVWDICSSTNTIHAANGITCTAKQDGWNDYSFMYTNRAAMINMSMRGLYTSTDAPAPFNTVQTGSVRIHSMKLQRDETGSGGWGPNLLTRGDPDTYNYVDQIDSAELDEIFKQSEQYGVYHKLTMFHKNEDVLNRFLPDGTLGAYDNTNTAFYSRDGDPGRWYQRAYERYFVGRWSYSTSLHSLELANETNPWDGNSYDAAITLANFVHSTAPRYVLMSDSFWHSFPTAFWSNPAMDYADRHLYASPTGNGDTISTTWTDSAAYVRECSNLLNNYSSQLTSKKPIVRGEGGVAGSGTQPQHPQVATDPNGTYYRKKLWAHVGILGYSCDGEWYPRLFFPNVTGQFPNATTDLFKLEKAYQDFLAGEPLNNGNYQQIGTDLTGTAQITIANQTGSIRAWGTRDAVNGKALLWIDNANQTWKNVVDAVAIAPAGGDLTVQGLPQGSYQEERWDTTAGTLLSSRLQTVDATGTLAINITSLTGDVAVKLVRQITATPVVTLIPSCQTLFNTIQAAMTSTCGDTRYNKIADVDNNRLVNLFDFSSINAHFNDDAWCTQQLTDQTDPCAPTPTPTSPVPTPSPIPGDIDGSGQVGIVDLNMLLSIFGVEGSDGRFNPRADLDGSGGIGVIDLNGLLARFGR